MVNIASQSLILLRFCTGHSSIWNIPERSCSHYIPVCQDPTFSPSHLSLNFFFLCLLISLVLFLFSSSGSHIIWTSLQLSVKLLLSLNSESSCLYFSSTGILRGVWYYTQPTVIFVVLNTVDFQKYCKDPKLLFILHLLYSSISVTHTVLHFSKIKKLALVQHWLNVTLNFHQSFH